ncbi:MAG: phage tail tube protein [Burkholderiales bacterium]|nr:phage tail tube protein [Burkholderiales bacterium]
MAQVTGRVFIALNGQRIRSKEGATLDVGGVDREAAVSDAGVDGYSEKVVQAKVECKINDTADIRIDDIRKFKDGTLTFQTDTGKVYTCINAWCANPPKMTKGEWDLSFEAAECLEG